MLKIIIVAVVSFFFLTGCHGKWVSEAKSSSSCYFIENALVDIKQQLPDSVTQRMSKTESLAFVSSYPDFFSEYRNVSKSIDEVLVIRDGTNIILGFFSKGCFVFKAFMTDIEFTGLFGKGI